MRFGALRCLDCTQRDVLAGQASQTRLLIFRQMPRLKGHPCDDMIPIYPRHQRLKVVRHLTIPAFASGIFRARPPIPVIDLAAAAGSVDLMKSLFVWGQCLGSCYLRLGTDGLGGARQFSAGSPCGGGEFGRSSRAERMAFAGLLNVIAGAFEYRCGCESGTCPDIGLGSCHRGRSGM